MAKYKRITEFLEATAMLSGCRWPSGGMNFEFREISQKRIKFKELSNVVGGLYNGIFNVDDFREIAGDGLWQRDELSKRIYIFFKRIFGIGFDGLSEWLIGLIDDYPSLELCYVCDRIDDDFSILLIVLNGDGKTFLLDLYFQFD